MLDFFFFASIKQAAELGYLFRDYISPKDCFQFLCMLCYAVYLIKIKVSKAVYFGELLLLSSHPVV